MMNKQVGSSDFDAFVSRQQTASPQAERAYWESERKEWLDYLRKLYGQTESFLKDYVPERIKIDYRDIELNEENIGAYSAQEMILRIGRQEITLTPAGTLFFYTKGRVDVVGPAGRTRFVLVDSEASGPPRKVTVTIGKPDSPAAEAAPREISWEWKIATGPPTIQYIELTQESLFQALMEVANG
jgi:hypothetical protein